MTKKVIKTILIILLIFITIFTLFIWFAQPIMLFRPWHDKESYEKLKNLDGLVEEVNIKSGFGMNLNGWIIYNNSKEEKSPTIVYYLPNMGNASNLAYLLTMTDKLKYFEGYNFIVVDYPGYGLSEGKPNEENVLDTGISLYDYAASLDCTDKDNIVVMSYSIGTGVGTYVASQRDVSGLVLIAPYDEFASIGNGVLNVFHGPLKSLQRFKFESYKYAEDVKVSPLIFTSTGDKLIKKEYTDRLIKHFDDIENIKVYDGIGHNDYFLQQDMFEEIYNYLQERLIIE